MVGRCDLNTSQENCIADAHEEFRSGRRRRFGVFTVIGAVAALVLLFAYHQDLGRAIRDGEEELRTGHAISLEGGPIGNLKTSLRAITGTLSQYDQKRLGDLVDVVEHHSSRRSEDSSPNKLVQWASGQGSQSVRGSADDSQGDAANAGCDSACMDALAGRLALPRKRKPADFGGNLASKDYLTGSSAKPAESDGSYNVGQVASPLSACALSDTDVCYAVTRSGRSAR